jgi:hypothetical protein
MMKLFDFDIYCADDINRHRATVYKLQNWYGLNRDKKKEDFVWDEEKSVRWNREETQRFNDEIDIKIEKLQQEYREACELLETAIADYIIDDLIYEGITISKEKAIAIWRWLECEHDDDAANWLSCVLELVAKVMK